MFTCVCADTCACVRDASAPVGTLWSSNLCSSNSDTWLLLRSCSTGNASKKVKVCFYIGQYPVRWTAQSASHLSSPGRPVHPDTNSASLGSILATQQLRNDYSLTFPPLSSYVLIHTVEWTRASWRERK